MFVINKCSHSTAAGFNLLYSQAIVLKLVLGFNVTLEPLQPEYDQSTDSIIEIEQFRSSFYKTKNIVTFDYFQEEFDLKHHIRCIITSD